ncbi:hypothetical protein [Methanomethylophilus alvi]|uniref:hypothetical protein n=1 Tax=Methanomethylophilus alvi TaxID=1291540 RepID=UPI0037DC5CFF
MEKLPTVTTNKETTQIGPESPETEKMKSEEVSEDKFTVKKNIADSIEKTLRMPKIHEGVSEDTVRYLRQCANPYCRCITNGKKAVCPLCGEDLDSTNYSISKSKFSEGKIKLSPPSLYSCYMDALKRAGWYSYIYLIMALLELGLCVSIKNDEVGGDLSLLIALLSSGAFWCAYLAHILEIDVRSQVLMVLFGVFLNIILGTFDLIILLEGYLCVWIIDILMLIGLFSILFVHPGKIYTSVTPGLTEDQYDEHEYGIYENMEEDE